MNPSLIGSMLLFIVAPAVAVDINPADGCRKNPAVVAACYSIRGRIAAYNGTPSLRIWPVGSNRLLGILPVEHEIIPDNIRGKVSFESSVYANLEVCPFTFSQHGTMQFVCVESASNLWVGPGR